MRYLKNSLSILAVLLLASSCGQKQERLLFTSYRSGNNEIYVMDGDGTNVQRLTFSAEKEYAPVWLNEKEASFLRESEDVITRHKIDLKTREISALDKPEACPQLTSNVLPAPVSDMYLYECEGDIFLVEGNNAPVNLSAKMSGTAKQATWAPREDAVIFTSDASGNHEIYLVELNTKQIKNLTNNPSNDERGALSPDGSTLLFSSNRDRKYGQDLFLLDLESGELENITHRKGNDMIARWSKDGESIYFESSRDDDWEIYRYNRETERTKRLTRNNAYDGDIRVR